MSECDVDGFKGFTEYDYCPEVPDDDLDGFRRFQEDDVQTAVNSVDDSAVEVDQGRSRSQFGRVLSN